MSLQDYLTAVEAAFRAYGNGQAEVPLPTHIATPGGTFHAKGAGLLLDKPYVAVKVNGNFPGNLQLRGLPTIQGVIVLCDGVDGTVLAVMDSIEITSRRTAAATALAARYLAPADTETVAVCGCGVQGRAQLEALAAAMRIRRVLAWDIDEGNARQFARDMGETLGLEVDVSAEPQHATRQARVIVTATTARVPFVTEEMIPPGAFVAAVGADNPEKSELTPGLMANAKIVVDMLAQATTMGDLHHAIDAGLMTADDVHGELADLVVGRKPGRVSGSETFVFDSTGMAIQDVASAVAIWQRAAANNLGFSIQLGTL